MVERIENKLRIKVFPKGQMEIIYFYIFQHFQKKIGVLESSHKMILLSIYYTPIYLPLLKSQHITGTCICEIHLSFKYTR